MKRAPRAPEGALLLVLAFALLSGATVFAAPLVGATPPGTRAAVEPSAPAPTPAPATQPKAERELRFDALRFTGQLSGPHALVTRAAQHPGTQASLLELRLRFVHRIFETAEAPALVLPAR